MATKLVKNYLMAIVAMVMVVGFSAFKVVENSNTTPQDGWYELDLQDPNNVENPIHQKIVNGTPTNPDGETCDIAFEEEPCMVQLSFPLEYTGPTDISSSTVADLLAAGAEFKSPAYARKDLE